jgi:single-stranded-DNA-specific exonuclease
MNHVELLVEELGVSETTAHILIKRGLSDVNEAAEYLGLLPPKKLDPFSIYGVTDAVNRIIQAITLNEKIVIYGDYDVDGVTGGSVYQEYLMRHTDNVSYYIPDRVEDGYGINLNAVRRLKEQGCQFILTVDNGIGRADVAELAKELGVGIVITDHHNPGLVLPNCIVVNPKINNEIPYIAGVGVAFLVCSAIEKLKPVGGLTELLDLVAIGTVADVVPLIGINRSLVRAGLKIASKKQRIGLKELIEQNKIFVNHQYGLKSGDIAFKIAPCLNAAGRIDRADAGVKLLTTTDKTEAYQMAIKLLDINEQRKDLTTEVTEKVEKFIKDNNVDTTKAITYYGEGSHHGVLGIVAARIAEKHGVPALILGKTIKDGVEVYAGSCRAPQGFNLFDAIQDMIADDIGIVGGGHAQAAGVSVPVENIKQFAGAVSDSLFSRYDASKKQADIKIDAEVFLSTVTDQFLYELEQFQPTGMGNPEVTLLSQDVKILEIKALKNNMGLRMKVTDGKNDFTCIGFRMAEALEFIKVGDVLDIAYTPEYNFFPPGRPPSVQLRLKKIFY